MLISGIHAISSEIIHAPTHIKTVYMSYEITNKRLQTLAQIISTTKESINVVYKSNSELSLLLGNAHHQGVVAEICPKNIADERALKQFLKIGEHQLALVLDQVTDTRNLGACLRNARAFNVDSVIIPNAHSASINHTTYTASAGALTSLNIFIVPNIVRVLGLLKTYDYWIAGLDSYADTNIRQYDFIGPHAIVMGSEGAGLRSLTKKHCDTLLTIPMHNEIESLNIAVATGIALYSVASSSA